MTREELIDEAVRRAPKPIWGAQLPAYWGDLIKYQRRIYAQNIRAEFRRLYAQNVCARCGSSDKYPEHICP